MLGTDSEEENSSRLDRKTFHNKAVQFQRANSHASSDSDLDFSATSDSRAGYASMPDRPPNHSVYEMKQSQARRPVFGVFQDQEDAFVPSENPVISTRHLNTRDAPDRTQYRPQQARPHVQKKAEPASMKLMSGKAARMMAKMGYKTGEGLGSSGKGIVQPIEAKLRAGQKAGLGSVNEQDDHNSDDEFRKYPQRSDKIVHRPTIRKPKVKYRTSKEIAAEAGGDLVIPTSLQTILDMTTRTPKFITNSSELYLSSTPSAADTRLRISQAAHQEVEKFAADWKTLQEKKVYLAAELERTEKEAATCETKLQCLDNLIKRIKHIQSACDDNHDEKTRINALVQNIENLEIDTNASDDNRALDEITIALVSPTFRNAMASWNALAQPEAFKQDLLRIKGPLRISEIMTEEVSQHATRRPFAFEAFMSIVWMPRVRTHIGTSWDPIASTSVLDFLATWQELVPPFLRDQIITQHVLPQLDIAIRKWNPTRSGYRRSLSWLFLWLPILGDRISDIVEMIKRRFNIVFAQWTLRDGLITDLHDWRDFVGSADTDAILLKHVLPKLSKALRKDFSIDPSNQSLEVIDLVITWQRTFQAPVMGHLFEADFFPQWLDVLYQWLTGEPNYEEISQWYRWWQSVLPAEILSLHAVRKGFAKGIQMMSDALEHGPSSLSAPMVGPQVPVDHLERSREKKASTRHAPDDSDQQPEHEVSFKDVVENWCAQRDLLLLPTRRSHESGKNLYKITRSTPGIRGILVYFRGDIVMMDKQQNGQFTPTSLTEVGSALA